MKNQGLVFVYDFFIEVSFCIITNRLTTKDFKFGMWKLEL